MKWLPCLLLGPITGPLALGMVSSLRAGRPVMASFYLAAAIEAFGALSAIEAALLKVVHH